MAGKNSEFRNSTTIPQQEESKTKSLEYVDFKEQNTAYGYTLLKLMEKRHDVRQKRDEQTKIDDYFKFYRTRIVLLWILTNLALVAVFTSNDMIKTVVSSGTAQQSTSADVYTSFVFWSVTALAVIRFAGSTIYTIHHIFIDGSMDLIKRGVAFKPNRNRV